MAYNQFQKGFILAGSNRPSWSDLAWLWQWSGKFISMTIYAG
jgi:hypothetical protein